MSKEQREKAINELSEFIRQFKQGEISATKMLASFDPVLMELQDKARGKALDEALNASVSAIFFADESDYLPAHYYVVSAITGVARPDEEYIAQLFNKLNP